MAVDDSIINGIDINTSLSTNISKVTINSGKGNDTVRSESSNSLIDGGDGNDYIYSSGAYVTVKGNTGNDKISIVSGVDSTLIAGKGNDTVWLNSSSSGNDIQYSTGDGNDVIYGYSAEAGTIHITNGKISKITAGTKKAPNDVVFTVGKNTVTVKDGVGKKISVKDESGNLTSRTYGATLETIYDSDVTAGGAFDFSADGSLRAVDASNRTLAIDITGNKLDNTLIGGIGNDTLEGGKGKDVFVYTGGDDIIVDYTAGQDSIIFSDVTLTEVSVSGNDVLLRTDGGTLKISNGIKKNGKGVVTGNKLTITDTTGIKTSQIYGVDDITIANGDGDIFNVNPSAKSASAKKRTKAIYLIGNANDNTLIGGSKDDTIEALKGNDVMTGGKGADYFIYSNGVDTITDYTAKQDKIKLTKASTGYKVDGKNVIFEFSNVNNTLTVVNGKDKDITVIDSSGNETTKNYHDPEILTLTKKDSGTYDMSSDTMLITIDGSKTTKGVNLIGNYLDNSIIGGKGADSLNGGYGVDTITSGKGDDTMTGGGDNDVFIYTSGDGSDIITDYNVNSTGETDIIQLGKKTTISKAEVSGNDYVFTIGKGTLTVQNGADKSIAFVDEYDNEIVYKKRAASSYVERIDLFEDDNFATSELDSILDVRAEIVDDYDLKNTIDFDKNEQFNNLAYAQNFKKYLTK